MKFDDSLKCCLRCNYFRLNSISSGLCKKEKNESGNYAEKSIEDQCVSWIDCGQNYFIRKGWIKSQKNGLSS